MSEIIKINKDRIEEYLSKGKRFDGRKLDDLRDIVVETGISKNAEGSARVKIGKTEVLVGIKMDIATPYPDSPDKGNLMVTAELIPLSSSRFENGPPRINAIELGRVIDRGIRESKFIETEKLCIEEGEKVWNVFIDIYSINDDGNLLDAAGIGAIIALKNAKIPKYDKEKEKVLYGNLSDEKIPLSNEIPIPLTIYKIGGQLIVDPNKDEEDICETRITTSGFNGTIFSMQKGEGGSLKLEQMGEVLDLAKKVREKIFLKIKDYL